MTRRFPLAAYIIAGILAAPLARAADNAPIKPPAIFLRLFNSAPPVVRHLSAAGLGKGALLFYDVGSMLPPEFAPEAAPKQTSFIMNWNGSEWEKPRPFTHVSEAMTVGDEVWALTDGGYLVSKDGRNWSALNPRSGWKEPFGCVVGDRPHVFTLAGDDLVESIYDGKEWSAPVLAAKDWVRRGRMSGFPFGSPPQAVGVSGDLWLLWLDNDRQGSRLMYRVENAGHWTDPQDFGPAMTFRALSAPDGLHMFYMDMTPTMMSTPSFSGAISMMFSMQSQMMRTSHKVYDGRAWSPIESLVTGQSMMGLAAARADNSLMLFNSASALISHVVRRDGRWSEPHAVPGTNGAYPFSPGGGTLRFLGAYLSLLIPLALVFGLLVLGISALIESNKPFSLDLAGRTVRSASLFRRFAARLLDGLVLMIVEYAIVLPFIGFKDPVSAMITAADHFGLVWISGMLGMMTLYFGYNIACEARWGRTLGKRALKIRVVMDDGAPCSWKPAAIRNALRIIDGFYGYIPGTLTFALSTKHQRLGDMAAKTVVVLDP